MKNFIFKSPETYQKLFQSIETIQKNVLYITYRVDAMTKDLRKCLIDKGLQKQVDQYFEDDETSPQTDSDDKRDLD